MALTPDSVSFFLLEAGARRDASIGNRYDIVFPVPVGEMAARSLP